MSNRSCQLSEQVLGNLLAFIVPTLLGEWFLLYIFEIGFHSVKYLLISHVTLLLEVPICDLTHVCDLQDQIQVIMIVIVDHLV